jgi:hypothetical protein
VTRADELVKLDALRKSGVLTQEEFEAEKAELLVGGHVANVADAVQPAGVSTPSEDSRPYLDSGESSSSPTQVETGAPLPPANQVSPPEGSPSDEAKPRIRHSRVLILAAASTAVIVIAVVILIISLGGSGKSSTATGSLGTHDTAAESNLQMALIGADTFYESANGTYNGIMGGTAYSSITTIDTGLVFVGASSASTASNVISVRTSGGEIVEMTAYSAGSGACLGVLDVTSPLNAPFFANYPQTGAVKTYYFSSQQSSAGNCKATMTSAQHLSSDGWSGPTLWSLKPGYAEQRSADTVIADLKSLTS